MRGKQAKMLRKALAAHGQGALDGVPLPAGFESRQDYQALKKGFAKASKKERASIRKMTREG